MTNNSFRLWDSRNVIKIINDIPDSIIKIRNISKHLYILSANYQLYHGEIDVKNNLIEFIKYKQDANIVDISSCNTFLYIVNACGEVYKLNEYLEVLGEVCLYEEPKRCTHGHVDSKKCKVQITKISFNKFGKIFITDTGQVWASGHMPQIGINSETPKQVDFLNGRVAHTASVGYDFAIAVVSKDVKNEDDGCEDCFEKEINSNCPECLSISHGASPISHNSLTESCPLGLKLNNSYDIETSTSSKNDSSTSLNEISKTTLNETEPVNTVESGDKAERNIIFRNTEAAKQFLTRKISWMSSAGEEYLAECAEKPSRIIKENVTNMASFVYEGVKTVGDKVATLSRHVSGSSDCNDMPEVNESTGIARPTSKEEFLWSLSQGTSEPDHSEHALNERINFILKSGSNLINCEVWTWGNITHGQLGKFIM